MDIFDGFVSGALETKIMVHPAWVTCNPPDQYFQDHCSFSYCNGVATILDFQPRLDTSPVFLCSNFRNVGDMGGEIQA